MFSLASSESSHSKYHLWNLPGGPVVRNTPSNAGDAGSNPGWGTNIPHAVGQLSPRATTTEPTHRNERSHMLQLRPNTAKNKIEKKI